MANKLPINHRCLAIWGGHFVECFDNTLYGFFAVLLAPVFFPPTLLLGFKGSIKLSLEIKFPS